MSNYMLTLTQATPDANCRELCGDAQLRFLPHFFAPMLSHKTVQKPTVMQTASQIKHFAPKRTSAVVLLCEPHLTTTLAGKCKIVDEYELY